MKLYSLFVAGVMGKGCDDSLMMWPSMMWVRTCGLTTAFGVVAAGWAAVADESCWTLGGAETGALVAVVVRVVEEVDSGGGLIGGPRFGIGGLRF